jgi:hypothetical protein
VKVVYGIILLIFIFWACCTWTNLLLKRKSDDDNKLSVAATSSGSITYSSVNVTSKTVVHRYNEDYLSFGFISSGEEQPRPKGIVCDEKPANQAMIPSNLHTKHSHLCMKPIEHIKRLIADSTREAKQ